MTRLKKKTVLIAIAVCAVVVTMGWSGWLLWTGPHGPTHVTVLPYVQPGTNSVATNGIDSSRLVWVARGKQGSFSVNYGVSTSYGQTASPLAVELIPAHSSHKYLATLENLPLNARIFYRVSLGSKVVREGSFMARKTMTNTIHFVTVGDTVHAQPGERRIAWQISRQQPEFFVHLGDIVYFEGTVHEYMQRLWPCYNDPKNDSPDKGAPIMGSVPFYVVLGNHDVHYGLNLEKRPDGLAAFYFFHAALNGPRNLRSSIPVRGTPKQVAAFRKAAGDSFPSLGFYSFENGPAHFLFLDGNEYTDFDEPALRDWVEQDLANARTPWKFVVSHAPAFQTGAKEYSWQQLRKLATVFQKTGVDVVFSGHCHNYQRTYPLKFYPYGTNSLTRRGWVNGRFVVDERFDGVTNQQPEGIVHVVSGAGGMRLSDTNFHHHPFLPKSDPANWVPYTAQLIADRYSFSDVTVTPEHFTLRQIDDTGGEFDRFEIHKGPSGQGRATAR